ncbi:hypothetical protein E4U55_006039 [Claviceps digitariae]|nr:hypothetical protein E4U55_006039 [Claviceps digitariae]
MDQKHADGSYSTAGPSSGGNVTGLTPTTTTTTSSAAEHIPSYHEATAASSGAMPTVDSPFTFPTDSKPPPVPLYEASAPANRSSSSSSSSSASQKPIAIPQVAPDPAAPFLSAYPPALLAHGITQQAWHSFLDTLSAFLTAKVSDRAVAHAGDLAKSLGEPPKQYGKNLASHAKAVGKQIARDAKRLNIAGLAAGVIGGAISLPLRAVFGAVHTVFAIPATALAAVSQTPKTPLQRAATYAAVASTKWLNERGLHAVLLDTTQLADMVHMAPPRFLDVAAAAAGGGEKEARGGSAARIMSALEGQVQRVKVLGGNEDEVVVLSAQSLWLVLVPVVVSDERGT